MMTVKRIARMYSLYAFALNIFFATLCILYVKNNVIYYSISFVIFSVCAINALYNFRKCKKYDLLDVIMEE